MPRIYMNLYSQNQYVNNLQNLYPQGLNNKNILGGIKKNGLKNPMLIRLSGAVSCGSCGK